jgi:MOSC domain-containing protein YiiM
MSSQADLFHPDLPVRASHGSIVSLHRSNGGVPKLEVPSAWVSAAGMEGDRQNNLKHHGGPDRALCLYSQELIDALRAEGHPVVPGAMGENIVIRGLDWRELIPGVRMTLGSVEIELTGYAHPCRNIAGSFRGRDMNRVSAKMHPGWSRVYARVSTAGRVGVGDSVVVL